MMKKRMKIQAELEEKRIKQQKEDFLVRSEDPVEYKVNHGGKREGSGRKVVGETKKVSISLPHGDWERFDELRGEDSRSAFLRELILKELEKE